VRDATVELCEPLEDEDYVAQSMPEASPAKWHLAHTSWFFEEFVLQNAVQGYRFYDERFRYLFNSYYNSVGAMHERPLRGLLTRPTVAEVLAYRTHVDEQIQRLLQKPLITSGTIAFTTPNLFRRVMTPITAQQSATAAKRKALFA